MKNTTVYLVHLPEQVRETALLAAREIFPRAQIVPVQTVEEAIRLSGQDRQLLVVGEISEGWIGVAAQTMSAGELPRWAVVHIGQNPSDLVETVPPRECSVRLLARIFRSAVLHHELLRENLQLRGDLRTLARRLNHDIRTPLGCIDAACSLFNENPAAGEHPHAADAITAIRSATAEIGSLLDRVSLVLKASSEPLLAAPVAMGAVVQRVIAQLTPAVDRRVPRIRQPAQWPEVRGVERWIEFVWSSLIHNALRHGSRGGPIQIGWDAEGAKLRFWASSAGAVPPALQPNLFQPFHLLHQHPSAGLGLSLVERIVALHGGRCGYESTADNRALFYFTLPAGPVTNRAAGDGQVLPVTGARDR